MADSDANADSEGIINVNTSSDETLSDNNISINSNSDTEYNNKLIIIKDKKSPNGEQECGQLVKTQGSTGTKPIEKNNIAVQPTIGEMFQCAAKQNPRQNESIEHALVTWIITNSQPLHVLQSKSFIKLINTLNPYYELSSNKQIKARIHQSYNYSVKHLKALFKTELKT
ncbi:2148_t:CDS:2, partial [Dentiscutata erythropus]